jgi:hypothetical protein
MNTFIFCSGRGKDFVIQGENAQDAWSNLVEREKDNGTLWRCHDVYCNKYAITKLGFQFMVSGDYNEVISHA